MFLAVISVGLSYETYSRVQMRGLRRRFCVYYIFTAITPDTILFAQSIKNHFEEEDGKKARNLSTDTLSYFLRTVKKAFRAKTAFTASLWKTAFTTTPISAATTRVK